MGQFLARTVLLVAAFQDGSGLGAGGQPAGANIRTRGDGMSPEAQTKAWRDHALGQRRQGGDGRWCSASGAVTGSGHRFIPSEGFKSSS
jgi:hypothetical protein